MTNTKKKNWKLHLTLLITLMSIFLHLSAIENSSNNRNIIWEPDDNYHHLIKAKNLDTCRKNCEGINNLLNYNLNSFNESQKKYIDVLLHTTAIEYHFVKSKILVFTNKFLKNWESSQILITKIVSSLLVILMIITIKLYFNNSVALVGSILLLPYVTIKYGYHFSNSADDLAAVFSFISIAFLVKSNLKRYLLSIPFSVLAIFSHPIGVFMLVFNYILVFSKNKFIFEKNLLIYFFLSSVSIILYFNIDLNYLNKNYNFLSLYTSFNYDFETFLKIIKLNIKNNLYFLYDIFNLLNFSIIILTLLILRSNIKIIFVRYENLLPLILGSLFIIFASIFHYAPETSIITRTQQILTLSIVCLYSVLIYESFKNLRQKKYKLLFLTFFTVIFTSHSIYNINNLYKKIESNKQTLNLSLSSNKIQKILKKTDKNKIVIFKDSNSDDSTFKAIFYKFILEGFNDRNILLDKLISEDDLKKILKKDFLLITPSPIIANNLIYKEKRLNCYSIKTFYDCIKRGWYGINRTKMSDLLIFNNDTIEVIQNEKEQIKLGIQNFNYTFELLDDHNNKFTQNKYNESKFITLNNQNFKFSKFKFKLDDKNFIKLNGLKISDNSKYNWPWEDNISLVYSDKNFKRVIDFNLQKMIGRFYCGNYELIDDSESYVILDMKCN